MPPLLLLRHAESEWNACGRWQGHADPDLSDDGVRQAATAAERISSDPRYTGFDLVVTSDLRRAIRTAELLVEGLGLDALSVVETGLRELAVGEWTGRTREEIERLWPGSLDRFSAGREVPPGGEPRAAFDARVREAGRRVGDSAESRGVRSLLVVAHGGVLGALSEVAGLGRGRVAHLAGYWGGFGAEGLYPEDPVDLAGAMLGAGSA